MGTTHLDKLGYRCDPEIASLLCTDPEVAMSLGMSIEELETLPAVVDVSTAARILGVGRTSAYDLVRTGSWPTPVLHLGRMIRIPTRPLLEYLGLPVQ